MQNTDDTDAVIGGLKEDHIVADGESAKIGKNVGEIGAQRADLVVRGK